MWEFQSTKLWSIRNRFHQKIKTAQSQVHLSSFTTRTKTQIQEMHVNENKEKEALRSHSFE